MTSTHFSCACSLFLLSLPSFSASFSLRKCAFFITHLILPHILIIYRIIDWSGGTDKAMEWQWLFQSIWDWIYLVLSLYASSSLFVHCFFLLFISVTSHGYGSRLETTSASPISHLMIKTKQCVTWRTTHKRIPKKESPILSMRTCAMSHLKTRNSLPTRNRRARRRALRRVLAFSVCGGIY